LRDHILKHTQIKKYNCPECNVSFARKSRLKIHMMIHKGVKPFQCNICQKQFREKSNFNFHMKKHNKKSEKSNFDNEKNNRNDINKSNSFSKNEIGFIENEIINKGNEDIINISFLKNQNIIFKSNINDSKDSGNDITNINNQTEFKNIENNIDNNEIKILVKDEFQANFSNIFNQIDSDFICSDEQKKSTDENSYLFNDNTLHQKYNINEQNNIGNTLNSINNEDLCINHPNNINQLGLMSPNNNIELEIKNKINDDTYLLNFP
jgi:uncharacterized Zn-finger protein